MNELTAFAKGHSCELPARVLFAYQVDDKFSDTLLEKFVYGTSDPYPFEAVVVLSAGAYFSEAAEFPSSLRIGLERGLGPGLVANDGPSQDSLTLEFCMETRMSDGFRLVGDGSPESALLAFATLATYASAGSKATQALLSASMTPDWNPIFEVDPDL